MSVDLQRSFLSSQQQIPAKRKSEIMRLSQANDFDEWNFDSEVPRNKIDVSEPVEEPEIEMARDAIALQQPFSPERPSLAKFEEVSFQENFAEFNDLQEPKSPLADNRGSITNLNYSEMQPFPESNSPMIQVGSANKRLGAAKQQKRRKVEVDGATELPSSFIQNQIRNTADITIDRQTSLKISKESAQELLQNPLDFDLSDELKELFSATIDSAGVNLRNFSKENGQITNEISVDFGGFDDFEGTRHQPEVEASMQMDNESNVPEFMVSPVAQTPSKIMPSSPSTPLERTAASSLFKSAEELASEISNLISARNLEMISFDEILAARSSESSSSFSIKPKKAVAASSFFEILVLATRDCIKVRQDEPYGRIQLNLK